VLSRVLPPASQAGNQFDGANARPQPPATPTSSPPLAGHSGPTLVAILGDRTLRIGDEGDLVRTFQLALAKLGYDLKGTGTFGGATDTAITHFQQSRGLEVDGEIGPQTIIEWPDAEMGAAGIGMQVLSLNSPGVEQAEAADQLSIAVKSNNFLAHFYRGRCSVGWRGGVGFCLMPLALISSANAAAESMRVIGSHSSGSPFTSVYLANCQTCPVTVSSKNVNLAAKLLVMI
jgi:peptidoglycan hydrolase-like protein with peptidoglycan-binding domain